MIIPKEDILKAKEIIGDKGADIIASLLHLEQYDERSRKALCCFHNEKTPSMIWRPQNHAFQCYGCGRSCDLLDAYMLTGSTFVEACQRLFDEADMTMNFVERGTPTNREYYYPKVEYATNKNKIVEYYKKRCISKETLDYLDIQQDTKGNILFQTFDANDVLVNVKVRPARAIKKGEPKCWWLKDNNGKPYSTSHLLFNRNKINITQPLIITCGESDCATCIECGLYNAVSIPMGDQNTQWLSEEWEFLNNFETIVLVHDNDEAGRKFVKEVSRRLGEYRVKIVDIPEVVQVDVKKVFVKDLNEYLYYCGKDAVVEVINNAKETEIPSIVDYTEIEEFDMSDVDGFTSGFEGLDRCLGKFYEGTTNILTGITGSGKSSFLSTMICRSIEQGFPCFVYSGELSNPSLKNWVDSVHAGQRNIDEYRQSDGFRYYKIRKEANKKINEYYKGQLYFYRDSFDHKSSNLLATMESVVRRYGVKTIILDNLSSINLENDDNNKWMRMDEFIRDVIEFSKKWQVIIFLVLHPKKMDMVRRMNIFDLQGVVSSVNLAHRVISLYRVQKKDRDGVLGRNGKWITPPIKSDVVVDILKDRYGAGAGRSIYLWYDIPSKRFYDSIESLDKQYEWDGTDYTGKKLPYFDYEKWSEDMADDVFGEVVNG